MYCVTITTYKDDYKHRYDSGVYPQKPKLFKTERDARKYVVREVHNHIRESAEDMMKQSKHMVKLHT